ncbi:MAG TPA: TetR/AcrR family transcriptional regulator [Solirubrobacteraceae bacterium]|jgi:AcrR family transcriptional regulator|nr:TetR/AcrR family transcriptional regulator [Solirubrobacteraceae bacterium]
MSRTSLKARGPRIPLEAPEHGSSAPPEHDPSAPLYRQLRPRPHGPRKDEVEQNQRTRLFGATIEAVAARGYDGTSVAELSRLAGVSKRTFYEQFPNKEACFLATHDRVVGCAIARVLSAQRAERDPEVGLRRAFEAFVRAAAEQPKAARLVLVDALGAGPAALARTERARRRFERMVLTGFRQTPDAVVLPLAVVRGIVHGIEHVIRQDLLGGGAREPSALAGGLAEWALAHGSTAVAELSVRAPNGATRPRWPRLRARTDDERGRILRAAAEIAAGEGRAHITPMQIVDRAGVSERSFRACYESAEECFLDALDLVGLEALTSAAAASRTAGDGPEGVYRGIAALMDHIAEDPVLRGVILMDTLADGSAAGERRERMLRRYVDLLASRLPRRLQLPGVVAEATVGALWGIVCRYVAGGAAHLLPELAGQATYVALAPIVGPEAAVRAILAEEGAAGRGG